jgi:dipeptidase D
MSNKLSGLKPEEVFKFFEKISQIPRCSGNERMISDYLLDFAKENGLEAIQDEALNIIIKKPATKGYEKATTVIIQGHMDMVCEKNNEIKHDFTKDPIELIVDDDFIRANGTTLGADDGIAVAFCLALLESKNIPHPPLEVLLTTDEETGMNGAMSVDKKNLNAEILINIDSEEEGIFTVSCAGGIISKVRLDTVLEDAGDNSQFYKILINGLMGGHSGVEIDKGRANANKIMGRILLDLEETTDYRISSINGGTKNNAIPRDVETIISIKNNKGLDIQSLTVKWNSILKDEFKESDPDINVDIKELENKTYELMDKETTAKIVSFLLLVPDGVQSMSMGLEDLVESSSNLGIVKTTKEIVLFESLIRSSVKTLKYRIVNIIKKLASLVNAEITIEGDYPAWQYKAESKIREICKRVYFEKYGEEARISATHGGLECGFFKKSLGDIDMISFGPDMYDVHTPNEHLSISSTQRTWEFLLRLLKEIKK